MAVWLTDFHQYFFCICGWDSKGMWNYQALRLCRSKGKNFGIDDGMFELQPNIFQACRGCRELINILEECCTLPCLPRTVAIALQETFRNLRRLTELDLQSNELVCFGNELTALTCLRRLLVNNNLLSHLPSDIHHLHDLELLDLRQDSECLIMCYDYCKWCC